MPSRAEFESRINYWAEKGGTWQAENPHFVHDPGLAEKFLYYTWLDPWPGSLAFKIYEIRAEARQLIWSGFYYWDESSRGPRYLSLGVQGDVCHGHHTDGWEMEFTIHQPAGKIIKIRNLDEVQGPDEVTATAKTFINKYDWKDVGKTTWLRLS